jgi:RNA polymerase sigma factor (sigma-70 family)
VGKEQRGAVLRQLETLFRTGTCAGLTDGQLLERYVADRGERSEAAFTALIARHGPMVLRICRTVLRDEHDAEDAFQATFLVLACKVASIRQQGSVASWLFGVASRVARCARSGAARRRSHERRVASRAAKSVADADRDDLGALIQEEVGRLPDRLRAPVVLCYFEGKTCQESADELGLPVGTVKSRLSEARARLRPRLARSGCAPDNEASSAWPVMASPIVPAGLARSTIRSVMATAACEATSVGAVSTSVVLLTQGVLRAMLFSKLKTAVALVAAIAALVWVSASLVAARPEQSGGERPSAKPSATAAAPAASEPLVPTNQTSGETVPMQGRVVGPDGQPVAGATVRLITLGGWYTSPDPGCTSAPDGRFLLPVPREMYDRIWNAGEVTPRVVATAQGFGLGWVDPVGQQDVTVRLVANDPPIEGRIVDAGGRPIRGVTIKAHNVWATPSEDLSSFIEDGRALESSRWSRSMPP